MIPKKIHVSIQQQGFTLIEIIIVLVVFSIFATYLTTYLSTAFSQSTVPVNNLKNALALHQTMELMIADYKNKWNTAYTNGTTVDLAALKTSIGTGSQSNSYGTYTVLENKYIQFASGTEQNSASTNLLKVKIAGTTSGSLSIIFSKK